MAKQARFLEQKLKLQRGEDESEEEDEEEGPGLKDKLWGANKRAYYQTEEGGEVGGHLGGHLRTAVWCCMAVLQGIAG